MKTAIHALTGLALLLAAGCHGYIKIDGLEATYTETPASYDHHPRWKHKGVRVYEIDGRYYREYNGRWVVYRERPADLAEDRDDDHKRGDHHGDDHHGNHH